MATVNITPRVARIHFDSVRQTWHLHISELRKGGTGTYTAPQINETFDSLTALLQVLLQFWLLAGPAVPAVVNAPIGSWEDFGAVVSTYAAFPSVIFTPDPGIG